MIFTVRANAAKLSTARCISSGAPLVKCCTLHTDRTYAYVMPVNETLAVDSPWDLKIADLVLQARVGDMQTGDRDE